MSEFRLKKNQCIGCIYSRPGKTGTASEGDLQCRRHAPRPAMGAWAWPVVEPGDWCGEYISAGGGPDKRHG